MRQDETLARLEDYVGIRLAKIPVRPESIGRWKQAEGINYYSFVEPAMLEYDYKVPDRPESGVTECKEYA